MKKTSQHPIEEVSVSVPAVVRWERYPTCPKCDSALGAGVHGVRHLQLMCGMRAQNYAFCVGDLDSQISRDLMPGVKVTMSTECFGIYAPHLHLACGQCGHRWLMECAPAKGELIPRWFRWLVIVLWCIAMILLGMRVAQCQALPDAPRPHLTRSDWLLFAADEGVRAFDAYSTERALRCACNRETNVPSIAARPGAEWAYSLSIPVAGLGLSALLERHHHQRWAKVPLLVDIGYDLPYAIRNMTLQTSVDPRLYRKSPKEKAQ